VNDLTLIRHNLFRKPLRTALLLISIFVAFLMFGVLVSFHQSLAGARSLPTRMVTLNKINFTETLPIAYYDHIVRTAGVAVASHSNWFGGYYQDPVKGFLPVVAVDPETYLEVHADDIVIPASQHEAFVKERTGMLAPASVVKRYGWRIGQRVPINSDIYSQSDGSRTWTFTLVGIIPPARDGLSAGNVLVHYDYFNETITFGRDRVGWVTFLTSSAEINDRVAQAIDARFANSADETSTEDESTFGKAFTAQVGDIGLVVTLVVGSAFAAILLIVGTTMALAVRERTREIGALKTLGFTSGRILRLVLGESLLLAFLGAAFGVAAAAGLLGLLADAGGAQVHFAPAVFAWSALVALALGLVTGAVPALGAYRMRIVDAFGRR
jgi:putative ABC transport system permease protein